MLNHDLAGMRLLGYFCDHACADFYWLLFWKISCACQRIEFVARNIPLLLLPLCPVNGEPASQVNVVQFLQRLH